MVYLTDMLDRVYCIPTVYRKTVMVLLYVILRRSFETSG
jgi:hypothetical protein